MYNDLIAKGYTHEEALNEFPKEKREDLERYIEMSFIESHFGMKPKMFAILITGTVIFFVTMSIILL